jgi:hypothetical protein
LINVKREFKPLPITFNIDEVKPTGVKKPEGYGVKAFNPTKAVSQVDFQNGAPPPGAKDFCYIPRRKDPFNAHLMELGGWIAKLSKMADEKKE